MVMPRDRQVAALPIRRDTQGDVEVLLVTSRETRRWIIPKGWPWPDRDDHLAAAEEAREEAGVSGVSSGRFLGTYAYDKRLLGCQQHVVVDVFLLEVTEELERWPECHQRDRAWFKPDDAADAVEEPELQAIIRQLGTVLA
jgi:8-oxo-dGTP pyrophosphatase MutT (NUDIX family)